MQTIENVLSYIHIYTLDIQYTYIITYLQAIIKKKKKQFS